MQLSVDEVQEILKIFLDSEMQEMHIEIGDVKVRASKRRAGAADPVAAVAEPATPERRVTLSEIDSPPAGPAAISSTITESSTPGHDGHVEVTAPLLGTFYRCPAPGQPPFVDVGSDVEAKDPVCIVEVMKLFNQVTVDRKGRVAEIVADDGAMVEFGQTLMWIEPAD